MATHYVCCAPLKTWTEEISHGECGKLREICSPRLPLRHESSKTPECSAEWMVNKEKQAVQKLSGAVQECTRGGVNMVINQRLFEHCAPND
jgi:hypothetical protein